MIVLQCTKYRKIAVLWYSLYPGQRNMTNNVIPSPSPSSSCWDILVWTKLVDWQIDIGIQIAAVFF